MYKFYKHIVKAKVLNKRVIEKWTDNLLSHLQQSILCTNYYILKQNGNGYKCLLFLIILIICLKPIYQHSK